MKLERALPYLLAALAATSSQGCYSTTTDVVVKLRDPKAVSVKPANGDPMRGSIPAGEGPALMKAVNHDGLELWVKRTKDGAIETNLLPDGPDDTIFSTRQRTLVSADGYVELTPQEAASSTLTAKTPDEKLTLPVGVERRKITDIEAIKTRHSYYVVTLRGYTRRVDETKTKLICHFKTARDAVVLESPRSNLEGAWERKRPSRLRGIVWVSLGALSGLLSAVLWTKSDELSSANARSEATTVAAGAGVVSLTAVAWGAYLLLAPETRTPLQ